MGRHEVYFLQAVPTIKCYLILNQIKLFRYQTTKDTGNQRSYPFVEPNQKRLGKYRFARKLLV